MRRLSNIGGIGVDRLDTEGVLERIDEFIAEKRSRHITYLNAHCVNTAFCDKEYKDILSNCDLVYPDGISIVWASYFYGEPLPERVNLGDFLYRLCRICVSKNYKIFLLGGEEAVAEKAALGLKARFKDLKITGTHHGFFESEEENAVIDKINESAPDILLVGMGVPRQEKWLARNRERLSAPVLWGVGGLFDYYSGRIRHAPVSMRNTGLEWLFRLFIEPGRLWKRYIIGNLLFLLRLFGPVLIDIALVISSWIMAYWLRYGIRSIFTIPLAPFINYVYAIPLLIIAWPVICSSAGVYSARKGPGYLSQAVAMVKASLAAFFAAVVLSFLFREIGIARSFLVIWACVNLLFLALSRYLFKKLGLFSYQYERPHTALIVGNDESLRLIEEALKEAEPLKYKIAGSVRTGAYSAKSEGPNIKALGSLEELGGIIERHHIDEVILADDGMPLSEKLNIVTRYAGSGVNFNIVSKELQPFTEKIRLSYIGDEPALGISYYEPSIVYLLFKEMADRVFSFIAVVTTLPLWLIIALIIKIDSNGPAIFMHERVGKNGRHFRLYKFRTMFNDVKPDTPAPLTGDDPRITRFGKFLRRWSLDEIPQFINVLKSEMSLVGPRPEMPFIVQNYQPWQRQRLRVKPGITGLWQIIGRKDIPLYANIEYDFYYINNRSFMLDLAIIFKSLPAIILKKGAY